MIENDVYKKLFQKALDMGLTADDIDGITKQQILNYAENNDLVLSDKFVVNAKALVKENLIRLSDKDDLAFLKDHFAGSFGTDFRTRFPNFAIQFERAGDKRIIKIHLDGLEDV